jgi:hypothetical protein
MAVSIQTIFKSSLPKGDTGFIGSQGFTGSQGDLGYTGSQGDIGFTGSQGDLGYTGSQGEIGFTGSRGFVGFTGSQGLAGSSGVDGSDGSIGYTGSQGYTGSKGEPGNLGYTGSQGPEGTPGTSVKIVGSVPTTNDLPNGSTSQIGDGYIIQSTGELYIWDGNSWLNVGRIVGYTGSQGNLGYTGSAGSGADGAVGYTGSDGYTGSQGDIGYTGSSGIGLDPWIKVTSNYTATSGNRIIADTTSETFTITLPSNPVLGSYIVITDGNDWGVNELIISTNNQPIEGITGDIAIDLPGVTIEFIWDGVQWQITATLGAAGIGVPPGGTTGQVLAKSSDLDYETEWVSAATSVSRYVNLSLIGDISPPVTGQARFYPPSPILITKIYASVSLQPTGGDFTFLIKKNGVNTGAILTIPSGAFTMTPVTVSISLTSADYLTVDVTGVGSSNLHIKMEYQ